MKNAPAGAFFTIIRFVTYLSNDMGFEHPVQVAHDIAGTHSA